MHIKQYLNCILSYTDGEKTTHSRKTKNVLILANKYHWKTYTKEDTSKTTTSESLSKIYVRKKISNQGMLIDLVM